MEVSLVAVGWGRVATGALPPADSPGSAQGSQHSSWAEGFVGALPFRKLFLMQLKGLWLLVHQLSRELALLSAGGSNSIYRLFTWEKWRNMERKGTYCLLCEGQNLLPREAENTHVA